MKKQALVTGALGLLGKEHICALSELGFEVVATDIHQETQFFDDIHGSVVYRKMDITSQNDIKDVSDEFEIEVLINNAAINPTVDMKGLNSRNNLETFSLSQLKSEIDVGLIGATLCAKYFGHKMYCRGNGNIINIASDLSVLSPKQSLYNEENVNFLDREVKPVTYSIIKHGLIGLTKYLATYWDGVVRCNALSPGGVHTNQPASFIDKISTEIPLKRMAKKSEYREALKFLAGDGSAYMNGHNLVIDGGRSIW